MFITNIYDINAVLVWPTQLRSQSVNNNFQPKLHIMNNKVSNIIQDFVKTDMKAQVQFVEPHQHLINVAEWAIQTFKNPFILNLVAVNNLFPLYLWDELLE